MGRSSCIQLKTFLGVLAQLSFFTLGSTGLPEGSRCLLKMPLGFWAAAIVPVVPWYHFACLISEIAARQVQFSHCRIPM